MKRLKYTIKVNSPVAQVYDKMLGLSNKSTYEEWTSLFSPTSSYEGNWDEGSKMLFTSLDDKGETAGMVSRVLENKTNTFVSIQHYGMLQSGKEITEGPEVDGWAGSLENYSFEEEEGSTIVSMEIDTAEEYKEQMDQLYPKVLEKLKAVCEGE